MDKRPGLVKVLSANDAGRDVSSTVSSYLGKYEGSGEDKIRTQDKSSMKDTVNQYYKLCTDFYEYGWGHSFHFSELNPGENREAATKRHQYRLALKLQIQKNDRVLDMGCGVGGPSFNIASITDAHIVGVNLSEYQIQRARSLTKAFGLEGHVEFHKEDFCHISFPSESFDKVYAIEATCHAFDVTDPYSEAFRLLKPGGLFGAYEWIMTDKYDPTNSKHKKLKDEILIGDGLPDLRTKEEVLGALKKVGFDILEYSDRAETSSPQWWSALDSRWSLSDLKTTPLGRWTTHTFLYLMETLRIVPKGSCVVHKTLLRGADALCSAGKEGIFTPMFFFVAKKPTF